MFDDNTISEIPLEIKNLTNLSDLYVFYNT